MKWKDWNQNLKIRLYGEGVINILFSMYFPFMAIYFAEYFGKGKAGLLLVLSQFIALLANLFGGYCADRFGRKKMMVFSYIGTSVAYFLFAMANSPWYESPELTFISFSLVGVWNALYWPASHAMVADVVPEKDRSSVFAVFYMVLNISVVIGPILGGVFFFHYRFGLLVIALLISVIFTIMLQLFVQETVPTFINDNVKEQREWYVFLVEQVKNYRIIATDKIFLMFILGGILLSQTFLQMNLLLSVYISDNVPLQTIFSFRGWSFDVYGEKAFSLILAENGLMVTLFTVLATRIFSHFNEWKLFLTSSILYGIAIILFSSTLNFWALFLIMLIFTTAELMVVGVQESYVAKLAPKHMRGQYYAAASLRYTVGRTIAPLAIPMTIWIGVTQTFYVVGILAFFSAGLFYIMGRLEGRKSNLKIKEYI
ncbi:MFS transporter [Cytobacillus sp. IB215665]|uniref:MDR family MFS transporter n=1 Tax=Cytobacillus sp. IB215665 TaxID=3097357 RepID=UPI002A0F3FA9|nr:MFS transporter [Cytobacillus sp. IB215665]MDX8367006.1 MFS transporter [Cytobacillus sp. IB215665]